MDTCKRMWSENQIGEIAKKNGGISVSYHEGYNSVLLGTFKAMEYPDGYGQPTDDESKYIVPLPKLKKLYNQSLHVWMYILTGCRLLWLHRSMEQPRQVAHRFSLPDSVKIFSQIQFLPSGSR